MSDKEKMMNRIIEIDKKFEAAQSWGSWMVMLANEREGLVDELNKQGENIEHKWLARRMDGGKTS